MLTAAELSERGARVIVLEKDGVGFEQSGRSVAAVNLPGGRAPSPTSAANGDSSRSMLRVSADEWSSFGSRWDCDIHLNAEGWHIVITDDQDEEWVSIDRPPGRRPPDTPTARRSMRRRPGSVFRSWLAHFVRSTPGPADMSRQSGSCLACAPSPIAWASRCAAAPSRQGSRPMVSKSLRSARGGDDPVWDRGCCRRHVVTRSLRCPRISHPDATCSRTGGVDRPGSRQHDPGFPARLDLRGATKTETARSGSRGATGIRRCSTT